MTEKNVTILFADITGSTRMFETLGDSMAKQIIFEVVRVMEQAVHATRGRVIKTIGDEVMAEFPTPEQAALAASDMQVNLNEQNQATGRHLQIHIGFHCGEVVRDGIDVFGDAVNVAARMVNQCRPGQILTTRETALMMSASMDDKMRSLGSRNLKGKQMDVEVYEILWQQDRSNLTVVARPSPSRVEQLSPVLHLVYRQNRVSIKHDDTPFLLGREPETSFDKHLVVDDDCVSRIHAVIEYHSGQFSLNDRSTNGTWVYRGQKENLYIHQESYLLSSSGSISLGQDMFNNNEHRIDYLVEKEEGI